MSATPGPWVASETSVYDMRGEQVAGCVICGPGDGITEEQAEANARLIAAAPDLLEALKAIAEGCSFPEDDVQRAVRDRARAAIAKATQP